MKRTHSLVATAMLWLFALSVTGWSIIDQVMGAEPSMGNRAIRGDNVDSIYYRRPSTRMGVVWAVREAFYHP